MGRNLTNLPISASFQYLTQISGSELTDGLGADIDSLNISASYATSASHAIFADTAGFATDVNALYTASVSDATISFLKGGGGTFPITVDNVANATSASYATTASFALNVTTPSLQEVTDVGSISTNPLQVATGGQSSTLSGVELSTNGGSFTVTGGTTTNGFLTLRANDTNDVILTLNGATNKITSNVDISAPTFTGNLVGNANTATSSSHAIFADTASFLPADTNLNINSISASNATFTSASIGYLESITGSAKIIGDAFIILNNDTPTQRYAGLVVQDSGSGSPLTTASLQFDGQTNDWFYEYSDDGGVTVDHGVAMFGPEYNTKGAPVYNTANTLVKGDGGHHLLDSSITDDGTLVTINANVSASGYVSASSFIGDGSQLSGISSDPFPYTGSAEILGTLEVGNSSNTTTGTYAVNFGGDGTANSVTGTNSSVLGGFGNTVSQNHSIGSGRQNTISGGQIQVIMGGLLNTISATEATNGIFSGKTSTISGTSENSAIIGGVTNTIASHQRSVIIGGTGLSTTKNDEVVVPHLSASGSLEVIGNVILGDSANTITSTGTFNTIAGGTGNTIEGTADKGFVTGESNTLGSSIEGAILGGSGNSISGGTRNPVVIGSISSAVTGASGLRQAGIYSSRESNITGGSFYGQAIIGSWSSNLNGSLSVIAGGSSQTNSGTYSFIGGGTNHTISSGADRNAIVGGQQNTMSAGDASGILGGYLNETTATTTAVVGGRNNTAGHQDSVVLGGDGLSTTKTQEAVVEHLTANGQVKGAINTLTDVAGTTTLDCSVGNYFTLAMPAGGTTVLTPSNITAGQTINIKITQNATAATLTYAASIDFPGGTAFTISTGSGEVDVLTLVSFDGTTLQATGLANFS